MTYTTKLYYYSFNYELKKQRKNKPLTVLQEPSQLPQTKHYLKSQITLRSISYFGGVKTLDTGFNDSEVTRHTKIPKTNTIFIN